MRAFVIGLNHKTAPPEIRGKVAFAPQQSREALARLKARFPGCGFVLLSTCNRTELYGSVANRESMPSCLEVLLEGRDIELLSLQNYIYSLEGITAIRHLFRVSAALDSMVLGEDQILGQVKESLDWSQEVNASDLYLDVLFRHAITAAKRIKTDTGIARHSLSLGVLAAKACEKELGSLQGRSALIIGSGKMGVLAARNLVQAGISRLWMTRRSKHSREDNAPVDDLPVVMIPYDERHQWIPQCDVVVSATQCPFYTLKKEHVQTKSLDQGSTVFIDLAVPRDIDPQIQDIPGSACFDLDALQKISLGNMELRQSEVLEAERILESTILDFERWWIHRKAIPMLRRVRANIRNNYRSAEVAMIKRLRKNGLSMEDGQMEAFLRSQFESLAAESFDTLFFRLREHCNPDELHILYACLDRAFRKW